MIQMIDRIHINQFTQNICSIENMVQWFTSMDPNNKLEFISELIYIVDQSHPNDSDILEAISFASIKKTSNTTRTIMKNKSENFKLNYRLKEIDSKELINAWIIMLWILKVADTRRKSNENPNECNHWWHKDLSDCEYISWLVNEYNK